MGLKTVEALIDGGKATPAPPLGPTLSVFKVNIGKIIQDINEKTKHYNGMKVPVKIMIDDETKNYTIEIGTPPTSSLIRKELGIEKIGSQKKEEKAPKEEAVATAEKTKEEVEKSKSEEKTETPAKEVKAEPAPVVKKEREIVGNLTFDQIIKITKMKKDNLLSKNTKKAVKEIVASCVSMPITVEGKNPKEVIKEIDEGIYDDKLNF